MQHVIKLFWEEKWTVPLGSLFRVKAGKPDPQIRFKELHRERFHSPGARRLIENREEERGARGEGEELVAKREEPEEEPKEEEGRETGTLAPQTWKLEHSYCEIRERGKKLKKHQPKQGGSKATTEGNCCYFLILKIFGFYFYPTLYVYIIYTYIHTHTHTHTHIYTCTYTHMSQKQFDVNWRFEVDSQSLVYREELIRLW